MGEQLGEQTAEQTGMGWVGSTALYRVDCSPLTFWKVWVQAYVRMASVSNAHPQRNLALSHL
jgi:hypothetical protein